MPLKYRGAWPLAVGQWTLTASLADWGQCPVGTLAHKVRHNSQQARPAAPQTRAAPARAQRHSAVCSS